MPNLNKPRLFAGIDVGSYALSMKIVELNAKGEIRPLEIVRRPISLGRDTYTSGKIRFETVSEVCEILKGFKQLMTEYGIKSYRAVTTSAVREAENSS